MPVCSSCQAPCQGKQCRDCWLKRSQESNTFCLQDVVSQEATPSDTESYAGCPTLHCNPLLTGGFLSDIEYVVTTDGYDTDDTIPAEPNPPETFSLIQLVASMVKREIAPLQKELEDTKAANVLLKEEIDALKIERANVTGAEGAPTPSVAQLDAVLAPYKQALEKIVPIEKSLENHQRYLDQDDAKKREVNVIITGVEEPAEDAARDSDLETVTEILRATGCDVVPAKVRRLGRRNEDETRNRPLLVVTDSAAARKKIMEKKSQLKNLADNRFRSIYIKPDEPLAVRKEWKRLRDALKKEKEAPTNQGVEIRLDYKSRKLLRDGVVIDEFKSPFPKRGPNL